MSLSRKQRTCAFWIICGLLFSICPLFSLPCNAASDNESIERLIEQLGNTNFKDREAATKKLRKIGKPALPVLRKARASDDLEIRRRVDELIAAIDTGAAPLLRLGARLELNYKLPGRPVKSAHLEGTVSHDEDLIHLRDFDHLEQLSLSRSRITNAGLAHIENFTNLTGLDLGETSVTDLVKLRNLKNLTDLHLNSTKISDASLVHLEGLSKLKCLVLSRTKITGVGLKHIKDCKKMRSLHLESATNFTDEGLAYLEGMTILSVLDLTNTKITDVGLKHLKDLHNLTALVLRHKDYRCGASPFTRT